MASTATSSLLLEKQANTENRGTWGTKVNTALDILDKAIAGTTSISTTGGSTTLTNVDYTADQAKAAVLSVTGVLTSNATIVAPNTSKTYVVINGTTGSYTLTVKTASGSGKTVAQGATGILYVDGSDGISYVAPQVSATALVPPSSDGAAIGSTALMWSDLFGASGFTVNLDNGNWVATHTSGVLTVGTGDLRVTTAGTNAASVATLTATQTLTNKTLALGSNTISGTLAEFDAALTDANFLVEADIGVSVQAYDADLTTWAGITPGANVGTFLATPSSANLASAVTDETGSGALVFGTGPTLSSTVAATTPFTASNTTDDAAVLAGVFQGDRATMAADDIAYIELRLSDSAGNQDPFARVRWQGTDVTSTSEDGKLLLGVVTAGTMADEVELTGTAFSPVANDGNALGTSSLGWSDLHLATGGTINWANGEILLTGAADALGLTGGSLGVGTSSPDARLHAEVDDATNNGITYVQRLTHTTSGTAAAGIGAGIEFELENNVGTLDVAATIAAIYSDAADGTEDGTIVFRAMAAGGAHAETMRITGTNVLTVGNSSATFTGILATTPRIQMHGTNGTPGSLSSIWANNNTAWPTHTLAKSRGASVSTYTIVQSGDTLGEIGFMGADGSALANAASIRGEVDGTPGAGDMPGRLVFMTSPDASTTLAEAMRISADKSVTIKGVTTVCNATATPAGGSTSARLLFGTTAGFGIYYGSGAPTVSAAQGSLYLRSDGSSTSTRMYVNTDGGTTWTAVTTAT